VCRHGPSPEGYVHPDTLGRGIWDADAGAFLRDREILPKRLRGVANPPAQQACIDSRRNQTRFHPGLSSDVRYVTNGSSSFVTTSGILPPGEYPQFRSWPSSRWDKPGGPFEPHTGNRYVYSQIADVSYKRLRREISVRTGGGDLTFWTSYDTQEHWDFLAVEARPAGGDWTTLPDENGHTTQDTGESCPAGWFELHPHLEHYQTLHPTSPPTCTPTGTSGEWNGVRQLERLAAVVDQPQPVRGVDGRDLDRLHQRLGHLLD
jgi:hypothetical protein